MYINTVIQETYIQVAFDKFYQIMLNIVDYFYEEFGVGVGISEEFAGCVGGIG